MDRRTFLRAVLGGFPVYSLLAEFARADTGPGRNTAARRWIDAQQDLALALASGTIPPERWRREVETLARSVEIEALMAEVGRAAVRVVGRGQPTDPIKRSVSFRGDDGRPRRLRYAAALFTFARGEVITPHAHRHMVSAHMVVEGAFRVRSFDRVRDAGPALVIRPAGDEALRPGAVSAIGPTRGNVHWFVPLAERSTTFDVVVSGLDAAAPTYRIEPVDPLRAIRLSDGTLLAPILSFEESSRFYTADR